MNNLIQSILGTASASAGYARPLYRVHRKHGHAFALFPDKSGLQSRLAFLLPAQSGKARLYRQAVRIAGVAGFGFPRETEEVDFPEESAVVSLLRKLSESGAPPVLLPGNPYGAAPRLVIICLDDHDQPVAVIKAGQTPTARELVRREHAVLQQLHALPGRMPAPRPFDLAETDSVSAFGMEFVSGESPNWPGKPSQLADFLTPWIDQTRWVKIADLPGWKTLTSALQAAGLTLAEELRDFAQRSIHPAWLHGDFAPWNVRVGADGSWTAIDWERGEPEAMPGWDWLHFSLQPTILVKKWSADRILAHAQSIIQSPEFLNYLGKAFPNPIPGNTEALLLRSYLLYNWHVLQPTERQDVQEELLIDY